MLHILKSIVILKCFYLVNIQGLENFYAFGTHNLYKALQNPSTYTQPPESCKPIQLQYVIRHGIRYPGDGSMLEIFNMTDTLKQLYIKKNPNSMPEWLKGYKSPYNLSMEGQSAPSGMNPLQILAKRIRSVYPFLPQTYSSEEFRIQYTYKKRTEDTAKAFLQGFFKNFSDSSIKYEMCPKTKSYILRSHKMCKAVAEGIRDNDTALIEYHTYLKSKIIEENKTEFLKNIGLPTDSNFSITDYFAVYDACSFDYALYGIKNQFCGLLNDQEVKNMEFALDLKQYWKKGYGYDIAWEQITPLLKNIVQSMQNFIDGNSKTKAYLRFAHGGTITPLMAMLKLAGNDPEKLRANMKNPQDRSYKASRLIPFQSNIGLVLYRCDGSKYKIKALMNEKEVKIGGCKDLFCSLDTFMNVYKKYIKDWNFNTHCKNDPTAKVVHKNPKCQDHIPFDPERSCHP